MTIEPDAVIHPFTLLGGDTHVGSGAEIGPHAVVVGTQVGEDVLIGPFCYTRPGHGDGKGAQAGRFVEIKNSHLVQARKSPICPILVTRISGPTRMSVPARSPPTTTASASSAR